MVNNCVACWPPWEAKFHFTPDLAEACRFSYFRKQLAPLADIVLLLYFKYDVLYHVMKCYDEQLSLYLQPMTGT